MGSDITRLRAEWGRIWTAGHLKTHIMPTCPHVGDRHTPIDTESYPESHVDLCAWCEQRFDNWRDGLKSDDAIRCERCGAQTDNVHHCRDCQTHLARMEARR